MHLRFVLPFVFIGLFYKLGAVADTGRVGGRKAWLWAAASAVTSAVSLFLLGWSIFAGLALQFALLVLIFIGGTVWGMIRGR